MSFTCNWCDEVVAQFYATLYVDDDENIMHFSLGGKRFKTTLSEFASFFKLRGAKDNNTFNHLVCLHDSVELEVSKMEFMYDEAYGDIHYGHPSGLTPYYKLMYLLFHNTLCPRGGNSDKISKYARNISFQMAPNQLQFNACHYLWSEIISCSYQGSACHYAPYVFAMVKHASKLDLKWDIEHKKYNSPKKKFEESFHLGKHCTWIDSKGPLLGAYLVEGLGSPGASSSQAPPPTQSFGQLPKEGPSHFRGTPKKMKGKLDFLAQGLLSCFNIGRQNAKEREKHMKWQAQEFHKA
jgi:hypothetical protein